MLWNAIYSVTCFDGSNNSSSYWPTGLYADIFNLLSRSSIYQDCKCIKVSWSHQRVVSNILQIDKCIYRIKRKARMTHKIHL